MVLTRDMETHDCYVMCNKCGTKEAIIYSLWANNEVPEGWLRGSDDKTHYCPACKANKYTSTMGTTPEVDKINIVSGITQEELNLMKEEWFKRDETLQPNQMRLYDTVVDINAQGGKQSHIDAAAHRLDALAMLELIDVLGYGDKKYNEENCDIGDENWRKLNHLDHINHALVHQFKYLKELQYGPDPNDPEATQHLGHAFCRLMFALGSKPSEPETNNVIATNAVTGEMFDVDLNKVRSIRFISNERSDFIFDDYTVTVEGGKPYWQARKDNYYGER